MLRLAPCPCGKHGNQVSVVGTAAGLHVVVSFNQIPRDREEEFVAQAGRQGLGL